MTESSDQTMNLAGCLFLAMLSPDDKGQLLRVTHHYVDTGATSSNLWLRWVATEDMIGIFFFAFLDSTTLRELRSSCTRCWKKRACWSLFTDCLLLLPPASPVLHPSCLIDQLLSMSLLVTVERGADIKPKSGSMTLLPCCLPLTVSRLVAAVMAHLLLVSPSGSWRMPLIFPPRGSRRTPLKVLLVSLRGSQTMPLIFFPRGSRRMHLRALRHPQSFPSLQRFPHLQRFPRLLQSLR